MQSRTALSLFLLATAGPASILGDAVTVWESATTIVTVTAGAGAPTPPAGVEEKVAEPAAAATTPSSAPPPSSAASSPAESSGTSGKLQSSDGQICINFSGNNDFHWLNTLSWGGNSGSGTESASQCFKPSADAGMFICEGECQASGDSSTAKYTKLECTLGGQYQNCDISLVDGFSLPLECTIPGALPQEKIGGTMDLDSLNSCDSHGDDNTCKNANAYQSDAGAVSKYFQDANYNAQSPNGNNYCIFQTCGPQSDIFFSNTPTISCVVGHRGASSSSTSKRDAEAASEKEAQREALAARSHSHRHSHKHALLQGLKDVGI